MNVFQDIGDFVCPQEGIVKVRLDGRWALDTGCEIHQENLKPRCNVLTSDSDLNT